MERILLLIFSFSIEAIIVWQYAGSLFTPAYSFTMRFLALSVSYLILFFISIFNVISLNILFYFVLNTVFLSFQFQLRFQTAFFHSVILTVVMGVSELITFSAVSRFAPHFMKEQDTGLVIFAVFSKLSFFVIVYLLSRIFKTQKKSAGSSEHVNILLILFPCSSIFVIATYSYIGESMSFIYPLNIMVGISAVFLLFSNLLIFGIHQYNQKKQTEFTEMQLLIQKEEDSVSYYEMLLSQTENQNILIHDIKKHLQSIALLNEKNESEKIHAYIHQLMDSSDLQESSHLCDNEILNAILCRYQRQCMQKQITFITDIRSGVWQDIFLHELTSLFCNLLDNAVEAAENIPDSFIELTAQKKEGSSFLVVILVNSCRSAPVYAQDGLPVSHKAGGGRHGFGIKSIKKVVKQYGGNLQMYYDNDTGTFHTIITLKDLKQE